MGAMTPGPGAAFHRDGLLIQASPTTCTKKTGEMMNGVTSKETDVLVIGGGLAGMRAAIEAHDQGANVLLILKGKLGRMNAGICSYHFAAVGPWGDSDDKNELHLEDVIHAGGYLADQELCKIMIEELKDRVFEFERYGLMWDRKSDGEIDPYLGAGHSKPRTMSTWMRQGGLDMVHAYRSEMRRRKIPLIEDVMATRLLLKDGTVVGVTALDYVNGILMGIQAKSLVIATGSHHQVFPVTTPPPEGTGDGVAMAYRAGAELMNMEFGVFISTLASPSTFKGILVPTLFKVGDETLHLLNNKGERIMQRYDPEHLEMATKDVIARSLQTEIKEGRGDGEEGDILYADLRHLPYEAARQKLSEVVFFANKAGIDIKKELIPIRPAVHETLGGIRINRSCESSLPGLYAAGSAIGAIYGNDGIPGRGAGHAVVFGRRAGLFAAQRARKSDFVSIEKVMDQWDEEKSRVFRPMERRGGIRPITVFKKLQQLAGKYFRWAKNEKDLNAGLKEILAIREEQLPQISLSSQTRRFNLEWVKALEVENLIDTAEIMFQAALMRKETRTMFAREDYPDRDDKNWLKHIVVKKQSGRMTLEAVPIKLLYVKPGEEE
jgi:succinate dehydrogenase/fumarate reductase flavoprotein subunit